jgi:hypothetical protein
MIVMMMAMIASPKASSLPLLTDTSVEKGAAELLVTWNLSA